MLYYTYIHRRSDTAEVFYVGKGQRRRAYSSCNRNKQWRVITQEIDYIVEIFEYFEKEQDAFSLFKESSDEPLQHPHRAQQRQPLSPLTDPLRIPFLTLLFRETNGHP